MLEDLWQELVAGGLLLVVGGVLRPRLDALVGKVRDFFDGLFGSES